jgi:hypothetical protein
VDITVPMANMIVMIGSGTLRALDIPAFGGNFLCTNSVSLVD